jgi:protein subunit release factor A
VTDHRIKYTSHRLAEVLEGGEELDVFIDRLNAVERAEQLAGQDGGS